MNNKTMIKVINGMSDKIDGLEEKINNIDNIMVEQYDLLYNKIEGLTDVADNNTGLIASINDDLGTKVNIMLRGIDDLESFQKRAEIIISKLVDKNDDLKSELNGIYKVLEMDSDDIQELQEEISLKFGKYNNKDITQDDFNNMMKEGHETLKRVKNNKMEGK